MVGPGAVISNEPRTIDKSEQIKFLLSPAMKPGPYPADHGELVEDSKAAQWHDFVLD